MTKNHVFAAAAAVFLAVGAASSAHARSDVSWSVGVSVPGVVVGATNGYGYTVPAPVYYAPQPVYVPPAPVYYAPPPPPVVYAPPRPVYYTPAPVVYSPPGYWRGHGHYRYRDRDGYWYR